MASVREIEAAREKREWIDAENRRIREEENKTEYQKYVRQMKDERLTPLAYIEWKKFLPGDDDPVLRGFVATDRANRTELRTVAKDVICKRQLSDAELSEVGFDTRYRPDHDIENYSPAVIADIFSRFRDVEPRFDVSHVEPIGHFLKRNRLMLVGPHIELAFNMLLGLGVIEPKPAPVMEPAPARPEGVNGYGVNLQIETDPAIETRNRRKKYETEIVVTDPQNNNRGWTQYELDHLADSETYRRLMRLPRVVKNPALEPKH
jgi:hypothetical protein